MILLIDGISHQINVSNKIYTSPDLKEFISIIEKREHKFTIDFDNTFNRPSKSFTTLQAAFREALLIQEDYK